MKCWWFPALAVLAGCSESRFDNVWSSSQAVMRSASKVEVHRLDVPEKRDANYWFWPTKMGPVALDAATSKRLVDLLLDERSYDWGPPKACLPEPGVKITMTDGTRKVVILVCFDCQDLFIRAPDGKGTAVSFIPSGKALAGIIAPLFPKDQEIQSLLSPR